MLSGTLHLWAGLGLCPSAQLSKEALLSLFTDDRSEPTPDLPTGPQPKPASSVLFALKKDNKYDHIISHFEKFKKSFIFIKCKSSGRYIRKETGGEGEATGKNSLITKMWPEL